MKADYPRVTHPCATLLRAEAPFAFDLHVLSTPPAFNLSQNQTLQFKSVLRFPLSQKSESQRLFLPTRYSLVNEPPGGSPPCRFPAARCRLMHHPRQAVNVFFAGGKNFFPDQGCVETRLSRKVQNRHFGPSCQLPPALFWILCPTALYYMIIFPES